MWKHVRRISSSALAAEIVRLRQGITDICEITKTESEKYQQPTVGIAVEQASKHVLNEHKKPLSECEECQEVFSRAV